MGKRMKRTNIVLCVTALLLLAGCSSISDKVKLEYKTKAVQMPPLEVPPKLSVPEMEQRYVIPEGEAGGVASYSEYSKQKPEQPCVAPVPLPAPVAAVPAPLLAVAPAPVVPAPKLQDNNGVKRILLGEPFDRSWRRVGLALDQSRVSVIDKDRSLGIYYVAALKKADKDKVRSYSHLVTVRENQGSCEVTVTDPNGKSGTVSARVIDSIYQGLNSENLPGENTLPPGEGNPRPAR